MSDRKPQRRSNGEGTISKRADGRWEARLSIPGSFGTRRRVIYGKTRDEVAKKLRTALKSQDDGLPQPSERQTVEVFLRAWLDGMRSKLRPSTWATYERHIRMHVLPGIGRTPLPRLQPQHLHILYEERLRAGLSPTTVRHVHAILHRALGQAFKWGQVVRNVAAIVDPPRRADHQMSVLSLQQVHQLLNAARGDRLEALYVLAVTTGMRRGELLALRWRDVDLEGAWLSVTATLDRVHRQGIVSYRQDLWKSPLTAR